MTDRGLTARRGFIAGVALLLVACAGGAASPAGRGVLAAPRPPENDVPSLQQAMRTSRDLGALPAAARVAFQLTLTYRDPAGLQALLDSGRSITAQEFATRYGPDPNGVAALEARLTPLGMTASWSPGDAIMNVTASAGAVDQLFGTRLEQFEEKDGERFHAPIPAPRSAGLGAQVIGVSGLDDYKRPVTLALPAADQFGVTPSDMIGFYDIAPLRSAGLDGSGQTVVLLDWAVPTDPVFAAFTRKFTPSSPIHVAVRTNAAWGAPIQPGDDHYNGPAGETALDVEVVHGIAPGARIVIYAFSDPSQIGSAIQRAARDFPHAIISSSIYAGTCDNVQGIQQFVAPVLQADLAAASQGTTVFWAAGDRGAYACLPDYPDDSSATTEISVTPDGCSPGVTSVGGTLVEMGQNSTYFSEAAWGEPAEQWGGGGGICRFASHPSWQTGPGIPSSAQRLIPDVSANADGVSGWDVFSPSRDDPNTPEEAPVGGTSAAAPFWAAMTALIDQDLTNKHLPLVGFANPALYDFARSPSGLPAPAFHDVTLGTNLHYPATAGWDFATGLGTPDAGALADDFEWYEQQAHKGGSS